MLINDVVSLLEELPRTLAAAWAAWLLTGLLLSMWHRHDARRLVVHTAAARHHSGVRSAATVRAPARQVRSAPPPAVDALGELEAMIESQAGTHHFPGESPTAAAPADATPALPGPKSLP